MSDCLVITTSWPIDATGSLPVCFSVILKSVHDEGTTIEPTLYCIASLASISVLQLLTVAAGLPLLAMAPDAIVDVPAVPGIAAWPAVAAGAAVIGIAGAVAAGIGAVAPGAAAFSDWLLLPPQAESTSVQATTSAGIFRFIIRSPWLKAVLSGRNVSRHVKADAVRRHEPITNSAPHEIFLTPIRPAHS